MVVAHDFHSADMWVDVTEDSHQIQWLSNSEFIIGARDGSLNRGWKVDIRMPTIEISAFAAQHEHVR